MPVTQRRSAEPSDAAGEASPAEAATPHLRPSMAPLALPAPSATMETGRRRARLVTAAWALTAVGAAVALFLGYEFGGTNVVHDRAQQSLLIDFKQHIASTAGKQVAEGSPVALLSIPRLSSTEVVVQGTSPLDLESGPGHYTGSPLPGEFGNALILGRRTTYGGPFRDLDQLVSGDQITVTTANGSFVYNVSRIERTSPGQAKVLEGTLDSRLTLVTSDPAYLPYGRLAVVAILRNNPLDLPRVAATHVDSATLGLAGDWGGAWVGAIWAALFAAAVWLTVRLGRRWPTALRNLLATPVLLTLFLLMCSNLDRVLPGTL